MGVRGAGLEDRGEHEHLVGRVVATLLVLLLVAVGIGAAAALALVRAFDVVAAHLS